MKEQTMSERLTDLHFQNDIGLHYCGKRIRSLHHVYGPMVRNHYLFVLVNQGSAVLHSHGRISFGAHDLLIMQPDERIHYEALEPWSITWLGVYGKTVSQYMNLLGISPQKPIQHISLYHELKTVMERIYDLAEEQSLSAKLLITGLLYEFFAVLLKNASVSEKTERIGTAVKMMDYNFCEAITVEKIAEQLLVDPAHFSRKFKEKTGVSPKKYMLDKRIGRAKELLCETDAAIGEISNSVGYDDQFYFCKIFKKYTNLSPSEYRKKHRFCQDGEGVLR